MRREPEFFGEVELDLLYIAKKLDESLALEALLTGAEVDYLVEVDNYLGGFLFLRERAGAFFYVRNDSLERSRKLLSDNGYRCYEPSAD